MLIQKASDGLDHPVSYFIKEILKISKKLFVEEKESLYVKISVKKKH